MSVNIVKSVNQSQIAPKKRFKAGCVPAAPLIMYFINACMQEFGRHVLCGSNIAAFNWLKYLPLQLSVNCRRTDSCSGVRCAAHLGALLCESCKKGVDLRSIYSISIWFICLSARTEAVCQDNRCDLTERAAPARPFPPLPVKMLSVRINASNDRENGCPRSPPLCDFCSRKKESHTPLSLRTHNGIPVQSNTPRLQILRKCAAHCLAPNTDVCVIC